MKLYHGTSARVARRALKHGLLTRERSGVRSQWKANPSREDQVYLTNAYAGFFAGCAAGCTDWAIIEVDTERLDADAFMPDEDFLEQATRLTGQSLEHLGLPVNANGVERTAWFRENGLRFAHLWEASLEHLGNCAYRGSIPPEAITRIAIFSPRSNPSIAMAAMDPLISLMNYQLLSDKYKTLTAWLIGDDAPVGSVFDTGAMIHNGEWISPMSPPEKRQAALAERETILSNRSGWRLIKGPPKSPLKGAAS